MTNHQPHIHNLPPQPTSFIGRQTEIRDITNRLCDDTCRLLTLVGTGGIGKTRLAIECVLKLPDDQFEHGIYYVPLAPLTTADNIVTTVINVLGIMIGDEGTPQEELVKFLSGRHLLLVVDNFEHVLDGVDLVTDILNHAPNVKILATSREALKLRHEHRWDLSGMSYPQINHTDNTDQYSAITLFVDRAKQIKHDFSPIEQQSNIIDICQLVEGLPLAIELAASWLKTLSCQQIIQQIEQGLDFLATRFRDVSERHRSIRIVFDHSWQLLSPDEQVVFPRLSVFRGGFTLEAAEQVADADLMIIASLVEKSMVRRDNTGRYDLHELLRQYGEEYLQQQDQVDAINLRHMTYFVQFMADRLPDIKGRRQLDALNEIKVDFSNIQIAWDYAIDQVNYDSLDQMMETLSLYIEMRALFILGEALFQQAIDRLQSFNIHKVDLIFNRLRIWFVQVWGLQENIPIPDRIRSLLENSHQLAEQYHDKRMVMICYWLRGELDRYIGNYEKGLLSYNDAMLLSYELKDLYYQVKVLSSLDYINTFQVISQQTGHISQQHQELVHQLSDHNRLAHFLMYAGWKSKQSSHFEQGEIYIKEALSIWTQINDRKSMAVCKLALGFLYFEKGQFDVAASWLSGYEQLCFEVNYLQNLPQLHATLTMIHSIKGQLEQALKYQNKLDNLYTVKQHEIRYIQIANALYLIAKIEFHSAERHIHNALTASYLPKQDILKLFLLIALSLNNRQDFVQAVKILGLTSKHMPRLSHWIQKWELLGQLQTSLKTELGEETYNNLWKAGELLDLEDTIQDLIDKFEGTETPKYEQHSLAKILTKRELEVLSLLCEGYSNTQIAEELVIGKGTVKRHTYNMRQKLDASNNIELVNIARKHRFC